MKIENTMKILSSKLRLKLLAHFFTCCCNSHGVSSLVEKVGTTQANVSKHLNYMQEKKVILSRSEHKEKFYMINPKFKEENEVLLEFVLLREELEKYYCSCHSSK
ncbi:helix-turn-helix transcriptional regulator [Mycoplasma marinum]|uniref:HTH arsR-type domain-containing protein n=1 Tax=Mycoplasma marinum TaxID=1937190 RepID=A0A4R0XQ55_9MOLU|nr:winged helix-turn-helix domain-containing protein [Mycoplasma marinum]TCG11005.1 hypothetical protein C4B24_03205 [Mycoplasma marinum]